MGTGLQLASLSIQSWLNISSGPSGSDQWELFCILHFTLSLSFSLSSHNLASEQTHLLHRWQKKRFSLTVAMGTCQHCPFLLLFKSIPLYTHCKLERFSLQWEAFPTAITHRLHYNFSAWVNRKLLEMSSISKLLPEIVAQLSENLPSAETKATNFPSILRTHPHSITLGPA